MSRFCLFHRNPDIRALITTGEGRFFCNGIDLNWLKFLKQSAPEKIVPFRNKLLNELSARLLTFPIPTIAAINGEYDFSWTCK